MTRVHKVIFFTFLACGAHFAGRAIPLPEAAETGPRTALPIPGSHEPDASVELIKQSEGAGAAEFPALLQTAVASASDESVRRFLGEHLAVQWARHDPEEALTWLEMNVPDRSERESLQRSVLTEWARTDPRAVLEYEEMVSGIRKIDLVLQVTARLDPEHFFELVAQHGEEWRRQSFRSEDVYRSAFDTLAKRDPDAVAAWLTTDQPKHVKLAAAQAFGSASARISGAAAYPALASIDDEKLRQSAFSEAIDVLIKENLPAAESLAEQAIKDQQPPRFLLSPIVQAKAKEDPIVAARWLKELTDRYRDDPEQSWTGQTDLLDIDLVLVVPANARTLREIIEVGNLDPDSINNLIASAGALPYGEPRHRNLLAEELTALPQDAVRDQMILTLIEHWNREDPNAARAFADRLGDENLRTSALSEILEQAPGSPKEILALAEDANWQGALPYEAIVKLTEQAPDKAITHIAQLPPNEALQPAMTAAEVFGQTDIEAGIEWIEGLTDPDLRAKAAGKFAWRANYDTYRLSEWATTLEPGPVFDAVAKELVNAIVEREPDSAWAWANAIGNDALRQAGLEHVVKNWQAIDPLSAHAAIENEDLPAETRQRLVRLFDVIFLDSR